MIKKKSFAKAKLFFYFSRECADYGHRHCIRGLLSHQLIVIVKRAKLQVGHVNFAYRLGFILVKIYWAEYRFAKTIKYGLLIGIAPAVLIDGGNNIGNCIHDAFSIKLCDYVGFY